MKRYIESDSRSQLSLLPACLDDLIDENKSVRVVEAFVDALDLHDLGFTGMVPSSTGRPGYHPSAMLKLYIYGYLNRIHSSRRLEKETHRNVELMWLLCRFTPDFKTIANFQKDNGKAIRKVCRQFVMVCRQIGLLNQAVAAVDGSKFKAVNNRDKNFTSGKVTRRIQELERSIDRYLNRLSRADQNAEDVAALQTADLSGKIQSLKVQLKRIRKLKQEVQTSPDKKISQTDPDARSLRSRGMGVVGYNVQKAVETRHHLIVAHDVTNKFSDRSLLYSISEQAKAAMGVDELEVIADRGYLKKEQIKRCYDAGIKASVPRTQTSNNHARGYFDRTDFKYLPDTDEYLCPAGDRLIWRFNTRENGLELRRYWSSNCQSCHLKSKCTPAKQRRVTR